MRALPTGEQLPGNRKASKFYRSMSLKGCDIEKDNKCYSITIHWFSHVFYCLSSVKMCPGLRLILPLWAITVLSPKMCFKCNVRVTKNFLENLFSWSLVIYCCRFSKSPSNFNSISDAVNMNFLLKIHIVEQFIYTTFIHFNWRWIC